MAQGIRNAGRIPARVQVRTPPHRTNHVAGSDSDPLSQYGVTGGGNDAAVYTRYGSNAVALGWPTKYSHSPAEESDTRDVDGLSRICAVLATQW